MDKNQPQPITERMMESTKIRLMIGSLPWLFVAFSAAHHRFGWSDWTGLIWPYAFTDAKIYGHVYAVLSLVLICGYWLGAKQGQALWLLLTAALGAASLWAFTTPIGLLTAAMAYGLLLLTVQMIGALDKPLLGFSGINVLGLGLLAWLF